ncbi:MAG: Nif3-like dinuclear metal center hexameric protein [Fusobacterium sp.]
MKLSNIIKILENKFPLNNAEEWDNVGLIIGNRKQEIKKVQISLDITDKVIENAINSKVNLIISHHPFIFSPKKKINTDFSVGRKTLKLISNGISVYTLHTNLDSSVDGLNDLLVKKLKLVSTRIIDAKIDGDKVCGIGRYCKINEPILLKDFITNVKSLLSLEKIIVSGKDIENKKISKIAVVNGSGSSYWRKSRSVGAEVLITGDLKYHDALDAKEDGMIIMDIGHYESERFFYEIILKLIDDIEELETIVYNDKKVLEIF